MFGFMKPRQKSVDPPDTEDDKNNTITPARRTSSEPVLLIPDMNDDDNDHHAKRKQASGPTARDRERYKNDFKDSGGLQNQTMEDLENYAVYKAEETTNSVNNCLRIAEDIREDATRTLDTLHQQGQQIERTHEKAVEIDKDLHKGEKLLNGLGGMFSKPWKPKKTREITGPLITSEHDTYKKNQKKKEQREKLGLAPVPKPGAGSKTPPCEPTDAIQKVEFEKAKQDDALSDLSNILGDLKGMAVDMGTELDRQNKALDHLSDDVDELNARVKGANQRARHLLAK
ncbi:hypothetical protein PTKIN_Ptkin02bG0021600 [Pterospermum kingtungense]